MELKINGERAQHESMLENVETQSQEEEEESINIMLLLAKRKELYHQHHLLCFE